MSFKSYYNTQNIIVIYPGRFQPPGVHHKAVYEQLVKKYGNTCFFATSNKVEEGSPLTFDEKVFIFVNALGIPENKILQVQSPYLITSYNKNEGDVIVFALGEKDQQQRFPFNNIDPHSKLNFKKNGIDPSAIQPISVLTRGTSNIVAGDFAYIDVIDNIVSGSTVMSASAFRNQLKLADTFSKAKHVFQQYYGISKRDIDQYDTIIQKIRA